MNLRNFDTNFPVLVAEDDAPTGYAKLVPLKDPVAVASVRILGDDEPAQQALHAKYSGDYMDGTPSLELKIGQQTCFLTWAEMYNLGWAMIRKAEEAYYG